MNKSGNTDEEKRWQRWQLDGAGGDGKNVCCLRELKVQYLQMLEEVAGFEALVMSSFEVVLGCRLRQ